MRRVHSLLSGPRIMRCRAYADTRVSQSMASYLDRAGSAFKALREPQNLNTSKVMRGPSPTRDETMRSTSPAPGRPITFSSEADTGSREKNTLKQQPRAPTPIELNAPAESPGRVTGCDQYPLQSVRVSAPRASAYAYGAVIATKPARSGGSFSEMDPVKIICAASVSFSHPRFGRARRSCAETLS